MEVSEIPTLQNLIDLTGCTDGIERSSSLRREVVSLLPFPNESTTTGGEVPFLKEGRSLRASNSARADVPKGVKGRSST